MGEDRKEACKESLERGEAEEENEEFSEGEMQRRLGGDSGEEGGDEELSEGEIEMRLGEDEDIF